MIKLVYSKLQYTEDTLMSGYVSYFIQISNDRESKIISAKEQYYDHLKETDTLGIMPVYNFYIMNQDGVGKKYHRFLCQT